jgi:hypothetical protein
MKCYRTPNEFAKKICRENHESRPKEAWFLVEDPCFGLKIQEKAPRTHDLKRVIYCVDRKRFAERLYGVWVENPSDEDKVLLEQRRLRQAFDRLRENPRSGSLCAPDVEKDVQKRLDTYLEWARDHCSDEKFNAKVLDEALAMMQRNSCFHRLETEGDPLDKAKQ